MWDIYYKFKCQQHLIEPANNANKETTLFATVVYISQFEWPILNLIKYYKILNMSLGFIYHTLNTEILTSQNLVFCYFKLHGVNSRATF